MKKLFIVVNVDLFFLSHRLPIALAAKAQGYDVTIISHNTGRQKEIEKHGFSFIDVPFERSGTNFFHELKCILSLRKLYCKHKPDVIHHVTLKACLLGSLAAKMAKQKNVVNAISGLGYNFIEGRKGLTQRIIQCMIPIAFKSKTFYFILQNHDDVDVISKMKLVPSEHIVLIKGSGVCLNEYSYTELPQTDRLQFLFPARMLYDKGLNEFIEAANRLKPKISDKAKFILAGDCDTENLAAIKPNDLQQKIDNDYIKWIGFQKNMIPIYQQSSVVVLPSYREGLPKSLIEACAIGRPVITTDVPGCKECVIDGYNGRLVEVKNADALASAILEFVENKHPMKPYSQNSRTLAEKEFSIENVVNKTLKIYNHF
ncbi:MAG: glycosyltransferase family 4 protein [Bacteroidales bacterium]|jgi:glycosyltransferase involved in cell wall biosynthesis|nr:glycosyltransferase family 4 protein [Bacteroidales bacterium]